MKVNGTSSTNAHRAIDWQSLHASVQGLGRAVAEDPSTDGAKSRCLLAERARELARRSAPPVDAGAILEFLTFDIGPQRFGIDPAAIREVTRPRALTPIPGVPPYISGIFNLRGDIVSAVDLHAFYELPGDRPAAGSLMVVLASESMQFGLGVDHVHRIERAAAAEFQAVVTGLSPSSLAHTVGITPAGTVLLDATRLLADPRMLVDKAV